MSARTVLTAVAIGLATTLLFRALAVPALTEDGPLLVRELANANGRVPIWYHAVYLPLGWVLEAIVGRGHGLSALLWASALSGGAGLGLAFLALRRAARGSGFATLVAFAPLVGATGVWLSATRVEVHATQFMGAAALCWAALAARGRTRAVQLIGLFAATAFAVACHNSNLTLLPGVLWIALQDDGATPRGSDGHRTDLATRFASVLPTGAAIAIGGLVGTWLNALSPVMGERSTVEALTYLVTDFAGASSYAFVEAELLLPYLAPLALHLVATILMFVRADGRRGATLPFVVAAAPALVLFGVLGVWTSGGYFGPAALFLSAGSARVFADVLGARTAADRRPVRGIVLALALVAATAGVVRSVGEVRSPWRTSIAEAGAARFRAVQQVLPDGGGVVSLDPKLQFVDGRAPGWAEVPLFTFLQHAVDAGVAPAAFAERHRAALRRIAGEGGGVAVDRSWRVLAQFDPRVSTYMGAIEAMLAEEFDLTERTIDGYTFLAGYGER